MVLDQAFEQQDERLDEGLETPGLLEARALLEAGEQAPKPGAKLSATHLSENASRRGSQA